MLMEYEGCAIWDAVVVVVTVDIIVVVAATTAGIIVVVVVEMRVLLVMEVMVVATCYVNGGINIRRRVVFAHSWRRRLRGTWM